MDTCNVGIAQGLRVVLVHDYLNQRGGAEKVVGVLHELFPGAPIYTSIVDRTNLWESLLDADIRASWMQNVPGVHRRFKWFFWLYPLAFRTMRLPPCDVVISSSSAFAKGVRLPKRNRPWHICYCHTPARFLWDHESYMRNETATPWLRALARMAVSPLRRWDRRDASNVDVFIANSKAVEKRIRAVYQRDAVVIWPPVVLPKQVRIEDSTGEFFLIVSRLVSYKNIELAIRACNLAGLSLVIIGDGPDRSRLQALAGDTVQFLGFQPENVTHEQMAACQALLFPGEEDFGMTPVEAHALGRPVVAYHGGGALDTVIDGLNGVFFYEQTPECLANALDRVKSRTWDCSDIRRSAERFSKDKFSDRVHEVVARGRTATMYAEVSQVPVDTHCEAGVGEIGRTRFHKACTGPSRD